MQATETIARAISEALSATAASVVGADGDVVSVSGPAAKAGRRIEIRIRNSSDFDVALFVPDAPGSPFEQVFAGPIEDASAVVSDVAHFVCDLVAERTVLVIGPRGRRFVGASELASYLSRGCSSFSWGGQHDVSEAAV